MNISEAAYRYIEHRPRTREEMGKHLLAKGFERDDIDAEISELESLGYLNDIEYVIAYLNYGFSKGKGIKLIKYELYDKGVSSNDVEDGIAQFEEVFGYDLESEEKERAEKEALKVVDDDEIIDEKKAMKIARRLSSKGYETGLIWSVIDKLRSEREPFE